MTITLTERLISLRQTPPGRSTEPNDARLMARMDCHLRTLVCSGLIHYCSVMVSSMVLLYSVELHAVSCCMLVAVVVREIGACPPAVGAHRDGPWRTLGLPRVPFKLGHHPRKRQRARHAPEAVRLARRKPSLFDRPERCRPEPLGLTAVALPARLRLAPTTIDPVHNRPHLTFDLR